MKKKNPTSPSLDDYIKASKRGSREAELLLKGPGFHATHRIHESKKTYTRKQKHKGAME